SRRRAAKTSRSTRTRPWRASSEPSLRRGRHDEAIPGLYETFAVPDMRRLEGLRRASSMIRYTDRRREENRLDLMPDVFQACFGRCFRLLLGLEVFAGRLVDRLHRQPGLAAVVEAEQLDLDLVAFLDHVGGLLHPVSGELADVNQAVLGAEEVHEGAELHHLD